VVIRRRERAASFLCVVGKFRLGKGGKIVMTLRVQAFFDVVVVCVAGS